MIPLRGSSMAGVTGDAAFAAQSGGDGERLCESGAGGFGETLPSQPGPAHTALILRSVMVSGVTVIVVF